MSGITIDKIGKIYGTYDNGDQILLGQIVVAKFANPAGPSRLKGNAPTQQNTLAAFFNAARLSEKASASD